MCCRSRWSSQRRSGDGGRLSLAESERGCSSTKQDEAREVSTELGDGPKNSRGALAQTGTGLTTFSLDYVSWLECRPLAALVCSVQRPNGASASPETRWFRRGPN